MRGIVSLIVLSAVLQAGCSNVSTPNLVHPGTEEHQQARAYIFEPYPENGPGPTIVGARPREYQDPRPSFAVLQDMHADMHPNSNLGPQPGDTVLIPCTPPTPPPQQQAPVDQPPIVTSPPAIYYPPGMAQP
jgi:hypothetical protein